MAKNCKSKALSKYQCITEMITHIYDSIAALFKGTGYENDWYYYHDALTLKTAKSSVTWMKEQGYYKRLILPLSINMGTPYKGWPVGNSHEMMSLDTLLNKYHDDGVRLHMSVTSHLDENNPKKFTMSTPKRGSSAYLRVWEVVPSLHHIVEDTNKLLLKAIRVITHHKGIAVADLGTHKGHRSEGVRNLKNRGCRSVKGDNSFNKWIHDDVMSVMSSCIDVSINKHVQH